MSNSKRNLLKSSLTLGLVGIALPAKWSKPLVTSMFLPAHAMTSEAPPAPDPEPPVDPVPDPEPMPDPAPTPDPEGRCSAGFIEETVNETIIINVTGNEVSGPIIANLSGTGFDNTETSSLGLCANNIDELTETVEFSGNLDSASSQISGDVVIRQFCAGVLACEQITTYTVTQSQISASDDGEYQGTLAGTLSCCQDFF